MKIEQTYKIGLREVGMRNELTNYGNKEYRAGIRAMYKMQAWQVYAMV